MRRTAQSLVHLLLLAACTTETPAPPTAPPEPPPPLAVARSPVVVLEGIKGSVERLATGSDWRPVEEGQTVSVADRLRTGRDATANLVIGEGARIALAPSTEVGVVEVTTAVQRLNLRSGRLSVDQKENVGRVLRVQGHNGEAIVEATQGSFDVMQTGERLSVATRSGEVKLAAAKKTVTVAAGNQSTVRRGLAPSAAAPIPSELLLKVARASIPADRTRCARVEGHASLGAFVTVNDKEVEVDDDGRFSVDVPRDAQRGAAIVLIRDVSGRERRQEVPCQKAPAPPAELEDFSVQWGK